MTALVRLLPAAADLASWLLDLAIWLLARGLNMPAPLVQAAGLVVVLRVRAFEDGAGRSLCPIRLLRRALALASPRKPAGD